MKFFESIFIYVVVYLLKQMFYYSYFVSTLQNSLIDFVKEVSFPSVSHVI